MHLTASATLLAPDATERWAARAFFVSFATVGALLIFFLATAEFSRILPFTPDDAYYYLRIAENIAAGRGLTFDGITRTSGFQPLWMLMLVALYAVVPATPETMTRLVLSGQVALLLAAGAWLFSVLRRLLSAQAALAAGLVYLIWVVVPAAKGMESAALIAALVALFYYGWRRDVFGRYSPAASLVFGLLLGIVLLARLDMVFLVGTIFLMAALPAIYDHERRGSHLARTLLMGVGFLVIVSPYLIYNYATFGALMPISGQLKSTFPQISLSLTGVLHVSKAKLLIGVLAFSYLLYNAVARDWTRLDARRRYLRGALLVMAVYVVLHLAHTLLFMHWGVYNWHFIAYNLFFALLLGKAIEELRVRLRGASSVGVPMGFALMLTLMGMVQMARYADGARSSSFNPLTYDAALWVREHTRPDDVFALRDTGVFGYFSRRNTINLDGLVNDRDYQEVLRRQELKHYLAMHGVRYLVVHAYGVYNQMQGDYGMFRIRYWSRLYELWSDELILPQANEVYRSPVYYDGSRDKPFVLGVWRMDGVLSRRL